MSAAQGRLLRVALLGNPNCGKTALFNLLTGSRQKVANYAGVTVERKEGTLVTPGGRQLRVIDLPGAYSLNAISADEGVTRDIVTGAMGEEERPDLLVCVTDATNLKLSLRLVIEARRLGLPMLVAVNLSDAARRQGITIDLAALEQELGVPVVESVGIRRDGAQGLIDGIERHVAPRPVVQPPWQAPGVAEVLQAQQEVRGILQRTVTLPVVDTRRDDAIDRVILHPFWGMLVLLTVLFLMFQAVFSWAQVPMDIIKDGMDALGAGLGRLLPDGALKSLLVDGILAGAGGVLVFLPQILILFLFILLLEDSGYLPRAAFLLDRIMGAVGLSGRSFIPLLSSFACAVPAVMATRTITSWRDRLVTIMIAPLMTCSARLPVYALLIGAFVPNRSVAGVVNLQGLVLFSLYLAGIVAAMSVAWCFKHLRGGAAHHPLLMELPSYRLPNLRHLAIGLAKRAEIFVRRVGTIILSLMILLWFIATYPAPPAGSIGPAIQFSYAGLLGHALESVFAPIGFNWQIAIALIPGLAAREVAVGALGTVFALSASGKDVEAQLSPLLAHSWSLATALSLLAWYVFAPQCVSTFAIVRRETNSWRYPLLMTVYLFAMAYAASFVTYRVALGLGG
ncbi:ferrous iron transporter B [Amphibiibacter pelophylacis]|uniref:Ferrous iron transporter B n=1 Tax=Amphibiibacter pelophylacis TaxID=1799477 RepID=A0ACC6P1S8_9BURK